MKPIIVFVSRKPTARKSQGSKSGFSRIFAKRISMSHFASDHSGGMARPIKFDAVFRSLFIEALKKSGDRAISSRRGEWIMSKGYALSIVEIMLTAGEN